MKVWVVEYDAYGDKCVIGVFSSQEKAQTYINENDPSDYNLDEFELDERP